jgi:hypothetical protein
MSRSARCVTLLGLLASAWLGPAPARAQQEPGGVLPTEVAAALVDFWNDPRRQRFHGPTEVRPDSVVEGDIAVLDGPLRVAGRVEGSVVVVNGDVVLRPGSVITGDLLVTGGTIQGLDGAAVGGELLRYPGRLHYRFEGERMVRARPPPDSASISGPPAADTLTGRARGEALVREERSDPFDFMMSTGNSYNRVEGLPITLGPRFRTPGSNPLQVYALAIYRTESGFALARPGLGYYVRAEQYLGGRREWRAGATAHSLVDPIEDWHLSDLENGLAAFLFHQDFRDHYEREGFSAFTIFEPRAAPLSLTGEVRWETHRSLPAGSPLTLFENAEAWRAQPLVAEGRLGSLRLQGSYDTRSDVSDPAAGWYLRGVIEQGFHADLTRPGAFPFESEPPPIDLAPRDFGRFARGFVDLRRYNRLSPDVRFNVRGLLGGSLTGSALPPQRQHAFGGEGSLPGYSLFSRDCGARAHGLRLSVDPGAPDTRAYPYYGCDAFGLVQAELRGKLDFRFRLDSAPWDDDDDEVGFGWDIVPDWVVFANGGTGWAFDSRPDERFRMDVGAGLLIDRLGIFVAVPLDGSQSANVFVRLGPRF